MHRTHIHFASEPRHLRDDDWVSVLLKVMAGAVWAGQGRRRPCGLCPAACSWSRTSTCPGCHAAHMSCSALSCCVLL